jgi:uncharacterized protein (TIGR02466 family)
MSKDILLFPITVQKHHLPPSQSEFDILDGYLNSLFKSCEENVWGLETGKSTGQFGVQLHTRPEFEWLLNKTLPLVQDYWKFLKYRPKANITCTSAWANSHKFGQVTGEHNHCGGAIRAHVSVVYYFKKPSLSGNIEFVDPLEYIHKMTPINGYDEYSSQGRANMYKELEADPFDLILFPSWVKHKTQTNQSQDERVAISMNFVGLY